MLHRLLAGAALALPLLVSAPALAREAPKEAAGAAKPAKEPSAGQSAARARQKQCGTEWRALTDAQKTAQGPKWPQYWSKCNKRLKGNDKA
ncbi:hypothetical protein [Methylobacterium radiodurans]|uniref:Uncharacterized protein n=1 Tax=Methylobacterium radiodurans TaxID=2202828 RepID=A0A2U8VWA8_9HYPH|nr:hypothetical protein [Methylobacterium radiodurans]AWN38055.1 hypothetical protein DK427_21845 [Methylobacterium radiodurans]